MRSIYFIRHSIRDFTVREDKEVPLTAEGAVLAEKLTSFFVNKEITATYSSPYLRAVQTAKPVAEFFGLELTIKEDLRERAVGAWIDNFSAFSLNQWNDFDFKLEDGESLNEVKKRMKKTYDEILKQEESNIIISGHGTALAVLFNDILAGEFNYEDFNDMKMPDIYCAKYEGDTLIHFFKPSQIA